jgi:predicted N-acetyltransferase YhbS
VTRLVEADAGQLERILDDTYPIWGEGLSRSAYGAWNRAQRATVWGSRHLCRVALIESGRLLASAKRYDFVVRVGADRHPAVGIGAVFTPEAERGRGHARALVHAMIEDAARRGSRFALLFSEIGAAYYEALGFRMVPRQLLALDIARKPGAPATFVRSGEPADLPAIADISARYALGATLAIDRSPELIQFGLARRRLLAGLGPAGMREVEFFVAEEGHRPVAYVFLTRGPRGVTLEECGDYDPAGSRVGSMLQVLAGRAPAEPAAPIRAWLPLSLRPPQVRLLETFDAPEIMMIRPVGDTPMPEILGEVVYWQSDVF